MCQEACVVSHMHDLTSRVSGPIDLLEDLELYTPTSGYTVYPDIRCTHGYRGCTLISEVVLDVEASPISGYTPIWGIPRLLCATLDVGGMPSVFEVWVM